MRKKPYSIIKKSPEYVLVSYSLTRFPRFKGGAFSGDFLGWSKPTIKIHAIEPIRSDQPVTFGNSKVHIIERSRSEIVLQFEKSNTILGITEKRKFLLNAPNITGTATELCDASCDDYFACWTSWGRFLLFFLGVKWRRWIDDCRIELINLPSYYSKKAIKRRWIYKWQWCKRSLREFFDRN